MRPWFAYAGVAAAAVLTVPQESSLGRAKLLWNEIVAAKNLPDDVRPREIQRLARRIRLQAPPYLPVLASNLAISTSESDGNGTIAVVAETFADALRRSPVEKRTEGEYLMLAGLVRYGGARFSLNDPQFAAALARLQADDDSRNEADFTLHDLQARAWNLKSLRGRVVLVNFWETWCPPCRAEIPDLETLYERFRDKGLVVLAITHEPESIVRKFVAEQRITYPVVLDPDDKVKNLFRVDGFPKSFVYSRNGRLAAQTLDKPNMPGWLALLARAGLQ